MFSQLLPDPLKKKKKRGKLKAVHSNVRRLFFFYLRLKPVYQQNNAKHLAPWNHSEDNDTSLYARQHLCANFQQPNPPLASLYYPSTGSISTPQCRKMSYAPLSSESTSETVSGSHRCSWSSPVWVQLSLSLPAYVLKSLLSWGYLIRPSIFTGPSSDLGSGERELQEVLVQSPTAGQEEVCVAHTLPITQKVPTLLSTHSSRG